MNIVYIHSHDTGRYIQPYGHDIPTPNLQRLADQGVLFRKAFCAGPTCSPSRAALLTGQAAHSSGMIGLAHRNFALNDYSQHLSQVLRRNGYFTALAGVQHEAKKPETIGYDQILTPVYGQAEQAACQFLQDRPKQPFFLAVGFFETHRGANLGFTPNAPAGDPRHVSVPPTLPDAPETRQDMADYMQSATTLDQKMGRVFEALEKAGLAENTLVICTTDHGIAFPRMKCSLTDHGMGVMLIMRGPHGFTGGKVTDAMVSQIDLFPTLCEMLNIPRPAWNQGQSLMPLIRGEATEINQEIFSEVTYHATYQPMRAVRTLRYKYIRNYWKSQRPVLTNMDDGQSKDYMVAHGLGEQVVPRECLYDLMLDSGESANLAADPAMQGVLQDMRSRLDNWMKRTNDPLLNGPVQPPAGALVNDPSGSSHREKPLADFVAT